MKMRRAPIALASSRSRLSALLQLLPEHFARRVEDLELLAALEVPQIPAEDRGIANQLVRRHFEHHDDAWLAELPGAAVDELGAQRRLARAYCPFEQDDVAARDAAGQDGVEPADAGLRALGFGDHRLSSPVRRPS